MTFQVDENLAEHQPDIAMQLVAGADNSKGINFENAVYGSRHIPWKVFLHAVVLGCITYIL